VDACHKLECYVSCYVDPCVTFKTASEMRLYGGAKGIRTPCISCRNRL
jgi:hypothetical protein